MSVSCKRPRVPSSHLEHGVNSPSRLACCYHRPPWCSASIAQPGIWKMSTSLDACSVRTDTCAVTVARPSLNYRHNLHTLLFQTESVLALYTLLICEHHCSQLTQINCPTDRKSASDVPTFTFRIFLTGLAIRYCASAAHSSYTHTSVAL